MAALAENCRQKPLFTKRKRTSPNEEATEENNGRVPTPFGDV